MFMTNTHTHLTALFLGLPRWAGTTKVKPIWILLKEETLSGSGISWAICKSAPRSRQITTPAPHRSVFYRPDALPATQPTASKHWRHTHAQHTVTQTKNCAMCSQMFRMSSQTCAGSSADTVNVVFGASGNVVINDQINERNIQTSVHQPHISTVKQ